ncbi:HD domain-containing phosphohydrolase [Marinitoga litoralis]|uniref:HD domain-containing phosphohydrolase n=1 Tax=Marinitoga litoralis TaxID=570855 RepID=UPI0019610076|nr:HD domain-containing phosphohydrolase [Marinitoga litoralis]MBM7559158.1 putative nucleotidyltransferase with HDIG domain [Marinitoga litoralis]
MIENLIQEYKISGFIKDGVLIGKENKYKYDVSQDFQIYSSKELSDLDLLTLKNLMYENENLVIEFSKKNILEILKLIVSNFKLESVLKMTEESLRELLESDGASILLYNEEKNVLNFYITSGGASGNIETVDVPIDNSIAGQCFKTKKTIIINDAENNPFHFKGTDEKAKYKTINLIATPLFLNNEVVGVLEAVNKKNGDYNIEDKNIIELFSSLISNKLINAKVYEELSSTIKGIILAVATAIDIRDNYTHTHSKNVSNLAVKIAKNLGYDDSLLEELEISALLHDIGKIGIPDEILNKPSKLTDEEYKIIQSHTIIGAELLSEIDFLSKKIPLGALEHHEKLDGSGYPYHKKDNEISEFGKILAVADIFDALTAKRVYKEPWPKEKVFDMLKKDCPTKFDCNVINALEKTINV